MGLLEAMKDDDERNNQILSVKIRDSEWRQNGWEETEAWDSISNLCHGAVTYAPWRYKKKYHNCLDGKWLVAWNDEWIICRNYGWHSETTKKWANKNKCGVRYWSSGGSPGICGDITVTYGGDDYNFEVEDPISGTVYWVEWIVMRRDIYTEHGRRISQVDKGEHRCSEGENEESRCRVDEGGNSTRNRPIGRIRTNPLQRILH